MFSAPTYIVLDLPPAVADKVTALRQRFDTFEAGLPPEITIAGSSGLGPLAASQDPTMVFAALERVGRKHLPFATSFVSVERFPGVPIFWLKPRQREPFDALQSARLAEGVLFESSPFPFNPHCTISATVDLTVEQEIELLNMTIPTQAFELTTLDVYQLIEDRAVLLRSFSFQP